MNLEIEIKKEEDFDYFDIDHGIDDFDNKDTEGERETFIKNIGSSCTEVEKKIDYVVLMSLDKAHSQDATQSNKITKDKRFQCQECGKCFTWNYLLIQHHDIVHKGIKPFKCDECGKCFSLKSHFTEHIKFVHKKIKPFQCEECGKCFSRKGHVTSHKDAAHRGLKLFKCDECGKCFFRNGHLTEHIKSVHKKIKPFQCKPT